MGERRRAQLVGLGDAGEVSEVVGRKGRHDLDRSAARQAHHGHAVKSPTYDGALTARGAKRGRANSWAARPTGRRAEVAHGGTRREVTSRPPPEGVTLSWNPLLAIRLVPRKCYRPSAASVGLITRRSQVRILPPLFVKSLLTRGFFIVVSPPLKRCVLGDTTLASRHL